MVGVCGEAGQPSARLAYAVALGGLCAAACVALFAVLGASFRTAHYALFALLLCTMAYIDILTRTIPNWLVAAALCVRAAYLVLAAALGLSQAAANVADSVAGFLLVGAGVYVISALLSSVLGREGMGGGDIKLFAVVGSYFGVYQGFLVVMLACALGAAASLAGSFVGSGKGQSLQRTFPFAPSIALACVIMMFA